jgi:hypothetical protein
MVLYISDFMVPKLGTLMYRKIDDPDIVSSLEISLEMPNYKSLIFTD